MAVSNGMGASRQDLISGMRKCVDAGLNRLDLVWEAIGLVEEQCCDRTKVVFEHVQKLFNDMVDEEELLKTRLQERVVTFRGEAMATLAELGLEPDLPLENSLALVAMEEALRTRLDALDKEKTARLRTLVRLREQEESLVEALGMEELNGRTDSPVGVPSKDFLQKLRERVENLDEEKTRRLQMYVSIQESVLHLMKELEREPQSDFEESIAGNQPESFLLSNDNIKKADELCQDLKKEFDSLEMTAMSLRNQVELMWNRLNVPQEDRDKFAQDYPGCKPAIIKRWRVELEVLEELKKQNMKEFIIAIKNELEKWWDTCMFGPEQRREDSPDVPDDEFTDRVLEAYEDKVESLRIYYEEHAQIYQKIEKRTKMWENYLRLEAKTNDPSRYKNRGGQLLKEGKERTLLKKELPKVERDLKGLLTDWQTVNQKYFIVNDVPYLDVLDADWSEFKSHKEQEKLARKTRAAQIAEDVTYGSKTPVKRKGLATPSSAAITSAKKPKLFNTPVSASRFVHSSLRSPRVTPGVVTRSGIITRSKSKLAKTPGKGDVAAPLSRRRILGAHNDTIIISKGDRDVSVASTGSYGAFERGLNAKDRVCRSSVIPQDGEN
ncbi:protein regulator of cytokinesis 1-like isoform X2 [Oscarella lobularis]|uniref:protein regulator of cytokinesis 1-like isoform X2 n=1 Tax=Oscarella lobularis TaxID=121494 RepID=UPI003313D2E5